MNQRSRYAASEDLGISQSGISRLLKRLSNAIGGGKLVTTSKEIELTKAGNILLKSSRIIINKIDGFKFGDEFAAGSRVFVRQPSEEESAQISLVSNLRFLRMVTARRLGELETIIHRFERRKRSSESQKEEFAAAVKQRNLLMKMHRELSELILPETWDTSGLP